VVLELFDKDTACNPLSCGGIRHKMTDYKENQAGFDTFVEGCAALLPYC
jgi:hypothetical protein